jgi:transaldolase
MKLFIDTANITEIRQAAKLGVIAGVTTNPSLIAKEQTSDFTSIIREITSLVPGPISAEVVSLTAEDMLPEARSLAKIADNIVIKIPLCAEGLQAISALTAEGIKTNATLIFTPTQALLAARAGATYVSPFLGRLEDIGEDAFAMLRNLADIFVLHQISSQIIAASIRNTGHVTSAALAGAHIATVPYKVLLAMIEHPLTEKGIKIFLEAWQKTIASH